MKTFLFLALFSLHAFAKDPVDYPLFEPVITWAEEDLFSVAQMASSPKELLGVWELEAPGSFTKRIRIEEGRVRFSVRCSKNFSKRDKGFHGQVATRGHSLDATTLSGKILYTQRARVIGGPTECGFRAHGGYNEGFRLADGVLYLQENNEIPWKKIADND